MTLTTRPFDTSNDRDWQRARQLLIDTRPITGPEFNWEIRHWDGNRYHNSGPDWQPEKYAGFQVWEDAAGTLAGVAHFEGGEELTMQIHPKYRAEVEPAMLAWGEKTFPSLPPAGSGPRALYINCWEYDTPRQNLLKQRNYEKTGWIWCHRILRLVGQPLAAAQPVAGYGLRPTRPADPDEGQRMADLLNAAFNRPGFHQAEEYRNFMQRSPSFCNDLNLVAVVRDGSLGVVNSFAAHAALTMDTANHAAIFEPVCTHPSHRRKGLSQAIMLELIRRAEAMGAKTVTVSTGSMEAANALYNSLGFTEYYLAHVWRKLY